MPLDLTSLENALHQNEAEANTVFAQATPLAREARYTLEQLKTKNA